MLTLTPLVNSQYDSLLGSIAFAFTSCYVNRVEFSRMRQKRDLR
jgi:hypothetical protein